MSNKGFKHTGRVVSILESGEVVVAIAPIASCEGCKARKQCGGAKMSGGGESGGERELRVVSPLAGSLSVGDSVDVGITYRVGMIAVVVAYVVPLVLFVALLILMVAVGVEEGVAALAAFIATGLYYIGVYLNRNRFERVVVFELSKRGDL